MRLSSLGSRRSRALTSPCPCARALAALSNQGDVRGQDGFAGTGGGADDD